MPERGSSVQGHALNEQKGTKKKKKKKEYRSPPGMALETTNQHQSIFSGLTKTAKKQCRKSRRNHTSEHGFFSHGPWQPSIRKKGWHVNQAGKTTCTQNLCESRPRGGACTHNKSGTEKKVRAHRLPRLVRSFLHIQHSQATKFITEFTWQPALAPKRHCLWN